MRGAITAPSSRRIVMPGTIRTKKAVAVQRWQGFAAGLQQHFPGGSLVLGNTTYTTAELVQLCQSLIDAITTLDLAQAKVSDAVTALAGTNARVGPVLQACERMVRTMFGSAAGPLGDFSLLPPKPRTPLTTVQLAAAAAKARATRKARGTKSLKQRLAIQGSVTGIVVTPITTTTE
jgi:hypothetical protein